MTCNGLIIGLIIGLLAGATCGLLTSGLCAVAKNADVCLDLEYDSRVGTGTEPEPGSLSRQCPPDFRGGSGVRDDPQA